MKKVEIIIRPEKLEEVKSALTNFGVQGMTVSQVMGFGTQKGQTMFYRGAQFNVNLLPKVKLEIVVASNEVDSLVNTITDAARTGNIGDGKIFILPVADVVRIRTGESGETAI